MIQISSFFPCNSPTEGTFLGTIPPPKGSRQPLRKPEENFGGRRGIKEELALPGP